jgi:glycosyltransferase involved in cell wall biosynthesis
MTSISPAVSASTISTLQLGMSWLPEQPGNGLDRVYHALATHLPEAGVEVLGLVAGSRDVAHSSHELVRAFAPPDASLGTRVRALRRAVRSLADRNAFDLVATHFPLYATPSLDLLSGYPLVVHFHGPWALESAAEGDSWPLTAAKAGVERLLYRRADRVIVLSEAFRALLCAQYGVDPARVRIVPGGVDPDQFAPDGSRTQARAHLGWPQDRPVVLTVRRLARRMGLEHLIEAVNRIRPRVPDVLLYIAGQGPLRRQLEGQIDALDLHDHVRLLGYVSDEDLPRAYRAADLSVVPTVELEGFGLITVESLAAGTPVLATPVGGLPEILRPLSDALVLPNTGVEALSDALERALTGRLSLPSSQKCRRYARDHYSWAAVARQVRAVYEEVL